MLRMKESTYSVIKIMSERTYRSILVNVVPRHVAFARSALKPEELLAYSPRATGVHGGIPIFSQSEVHVAKIS
jgi:hypothetical protein